MINISYRNITHYLKLGYAAILSKELEVKVSDLPTVSHVKIDVICSICVCENKIMYCKYIDNIGRHGFYGCRKCSREKFKMTYLERGGGSYIDMDNSNLVKAMENKNITEIKKSEDNYKEIHDGSYRLYKNEVRRLTKKSAKIFMDGWDGRDFYDGELIIDNFKLPHINNNYPSIDHKVSIYHGYVNNIHPSKISDISNLCITKRVINSTKRDLDYLLP